MAKFYHWFRISSQINSRSPWIFIINVRRTLDGCHTQDHQSQFLVLFLSVNLPHERGWYFGTVDCLYLPVGSPPVSNHTRVFRSARLRDSWQLSTIVCLQPTLFLQLLELLVGNVWFDLIDVSSSIVSPDSDYEFGWNVTSLFSQADRLLIFKYLWPVTIFSPDTPDLRNEGCCSKERERDGVPPNRHSHWRETEQWHSWCPAHPCSYIDLGSYLIQNEYQLNIQLDFQILQKCLWPQ